MIINLDRMYEYLDEIIVVDIARRALVKIDDAIRPNNRIDISELYFARVCDIMFYAYTFTFIYRRFVHR
jgi:hypothetical protein